MDRRALTSPGFGRGAIATDPSRGQASFVTLRLFLSLLAWFGFTAWLRPLAIPDEGRYVGVAREMLLSGQWMVPTLDGMPFFHKPPLFYWLTAASMKAFGVNVLAARGASILAAALAATAVHGFVRRWNGSTSARRVLLVLATMPLWFAGAQFANHDLLVAACISVTILGAAHAILAHEVDSADGFALPAAYAVAALGLLAKGLIGVVLPVAVLLAWSLTTRRLAGTIRVLRWWPGWLVFMMIAGPWFVTTQVAYPGFAHYFVVVQHIQRFLSPDFNNGQPAAFYPAVLLVLALPWSPWLLVALRTSYWRRPDPHGVRALMLCWVVVVTVFFSLPHSKLVGYILPVLPALAWLAADAWRHGASLIAARRGGSFALTRFRSQVRAAGAVCVALVVAAHFLQPKSTARLGREIAAARAPGEPVYFVGNQYFDLPFYADVVAPVRIVDDWSAAALLQDGWRRALVDAASFDTTNRGLLLKPDELLPSLCRTRGAWVVQPWGPKTPDLLFPLAPRFIDHGVAAWHVVPGSTEADATCGGSNDATDSFSRDREAACRHTPRCSH